MYTHCASNKLVWASIDVTYAGGSTVGGTPVSHRRLMKKQKLGLQSCRTGVSPSFRVCVSFWAILIALPNFKLQYKLYIRNDVRQIHTDKSPFNSLVWGLLRLAPVRMVGNQLIHRQFQEQNFLHCIRSITIMKTHLQESTSHTLRSASVPKLRAIYRIVQVHSNVRSFLCLKPTSLLSLLVGIGSRSDVLQRLCQ